MPSFLVLCWLLAPTLICTTLAGTTPSDVAWLRAKAQEDGVQSSPSGLMWKELRPGDINGKTPLVDTPCECHYSGQLTDGTEFDSSYNRGAPTTFAPNQVIRGWTEAMQMMKEGEKRELYIPSELAYGDYGAGGIIPPGAALIFTLELIKVKGPHKYLGSADEM